MRVFERIGRMVRADAHGVMDALEERSLVLRQNLREAELEVAHKRAELEAIDDERRRLRDEGQRREARVASLDEDVELARAGDDPELARFAVRRWLPEREALSALFDRAARLDERRTGLAERLALQEAQLAELRPRVREALRRPERAAAGADAFGTERHVTEEEIELELLRRRAVAAAGATPARDEQRASRGEEA